MFEAGTLEVGEVLAQFAATRLEVHLAQGALRPLVLGLCGAQGIGKSSLSRGVTATLEGAGWRVLAFSLDDLYLGKVERAELAREVHPLFRTRGVPGTHDIALGLRILDCAARPGRVAVPRFDKANDDRRPREEWPIVQTPVDLVLLEGWCVGAVPQQEADLLQPVNALEREEDAEGVWRRYANAQLAGPYRSLFDRIDALVLLAAPSFDVVRGWRAEQERELAQRLKAALGSAGAPMTGAEVTRFVQHYERLTRHILSEMPGRADLVIWLDEQRRMMDQATRSRGASPLK